MAGARVTPKAVSQKKLHWFRIGSAAVVLLAIVAFVAYDIWVVEQKTQQVLGAPGIISSETPTGEKAVEGSERAPVSPDALANYTVAADAPRALYIDELNIAARVQPMGVHSDKSIQAPRNVNDSGWYIGSSKPGQVGAMFIDGHASADGRLGLFKELDTLTVGDTIQVEKGDGTRFTYKVVHTETVSVDEVDMRHVLAPYEGVEKGLNVMTCVGVWLEDRETLDSRVIVYTQQVEI